jgi:signal transduction histidine kinase
MLEGFDRELSLAELLQGIDTAAAVAALTALLGSAPRVVDGDGRVLAGAAGAPAARAPLIGDLEPIGFLEADAPPESLAAAARLLQLLLRANARYHMASDLHLETVHESYAELQRKHEALKLSEARYRELNAELEQRVTDQVGTIDATRRRLYQSEKLAAVGQLAAGMAHEINNPVGFIKSNLSTAVDYVQSLQRFAALLNENGEPAAVRDAWRREGLDELLADFAQLLAESLEGAERVSRIVADLKAFSRVDERAKGWHDLNEIVARTIDVVRPQVPRGVRIEVDPGELPRVHCDAAQLGEVVYNLLHNAIQAVGEHGVVRVATSADKGSVRIVVGDNGSGIAADVLPRIFEPFFTTRGVGNGTGLGLAVSHDLVRLHGGRIEARSAPGKGSLFSVHLPVAGVEGGK